MGVKDYHELQVYQLAFESAMQIFEMTRAFPREETYSLVDQIRRSSRSVCANIAKAWRKRRYPASFVSKLSDADTEAAETLVWLDFALRCNYINEKTHAELYSRYNHICAMLTKIMNDPDSWCGTMAQKTKRGGQKVEC
jgi:four helix bundle protein